MLAHDKRMNSGSVEELAVSRKELMVHPICRGSCGMAIGRQSRPRCLTSLIAPSRSVTLEFFDPATGEAVETASLTTASLPFSLAPNAQPMLPGCSTPNDRDLLGVRVVARSERFSDGEQHALALLPNQALTTETRRMDVKGNETKTFIMEGLHRSVTHSTRLQADAGIYVQPCLVRGAGVARVATTR